MSTDSAPQQSLTSILIVDDEWMMVEVMTAILRKLRYEDVDFAADGMTAHQMMQDKPYGLVISDVNMEPMGGLDLLRAVRADPSLKTTPFILTTASRAPDTVFAAKRLGADHYLLKPFTPKQLAEKIEIILRRTPRMDLPNQADRPEG